MGVRRPAPEGPAPPALTSASVSRINPSFTTGGVLWRRSALRLEQKVSLQTMGHLPVSFVYHFHIILIMA